MPSKIAIKKVGSTALTAGKKALSLMQPSNLLKIGIGVVGIGVGIYFIRKQLQKTPHEEEVNTNKLSYPQSQYNDWADTLDVAMTGVGHTDEEAIYAIFHALINIDDLHALHAAFGTRYYRFFGIPQGNYSLTQWLQSDMNDDEIAIINDILASKGINYSF